MKKVISTLLAIIMLLPAIASLAFANDVVAVNDVTPVSEETHEGTNVAPLATLNYFSLNATGEKSYVDMSVTTPKVDYSKVTDGNKTTGTNTGYTNVYAFELKYAQAFYFTDIVIHINGDGTLPNGTATQNNVSVDKITVKAYKAGEEVISQEIDTLDQTTITVAANTAADCIEIYRDQSNISTGQRGKDFIREIETYKVDKEFCNVVKSNIASEALISAAGTTEGEYCDTWWAWTPKALVDGDKEVGTRSPKGWRYSVFVDFTRDYLISELVLTLNGKGELAGGGGRVDEVTMNISQIRVKLFNLDGEQVYDSKDVSVDSTEVKLDPFVEASRIKIEIGNGRGEGSEFMWEIETYVEEGNHIFEQTATSNPTCNRPGYIEYSCHCGKVIKKTVPATGFHQWDEGIITTEPTNEANGVRTKTCSACQETTEVDVPATGHNWVQSESQAPDCDTDGYTVFTCQDAGCDASYTTDVVSAYGHDWNDGVVTKKASVTENGEKTFTCMREGCGEVEVRQTRKLQYTDSTTGFKFEEGKYSVDVFYNKEDDLYSESDLTHPLLQGDKALGLVDDDMMTYWYGPTGSTYTITLDREYIFTKGTLFAGGNNVTLKVDWIDAEGNISATYTTKWNTISNGADPSNPVNVNMTETISSGAKAKVIKVTLTGAKWANGHALTLHGFDFVVHDCLVDESDYVLDGSSYVEPTCTTDGSCLAKCPVCSNMIPVTLSNEKYGHDVPNPVVDVAPTCSDVGYGHGTCTKCSETIQNVEIPALGTHVYDKKIDYMPAKCGSIGIRQTVCAGCGRVGSQEPIPATEKHTPAWTEEYCATYTDEGKEVYICTGCGLPDEDNGISERILPKKSLAEDFVTFVDYSVRTTGFAGIRITYRIDLEKLAEIEYECDVRIITTVKNADGVEKTIESYGKYSNDLYDAETGEFSVVIKPSTYYDEYEVTTKVRFMNFRGIEYYDVELGTLSTDSNNKISLCEVAEYVLATNGSLGNNEKAFYEEIVAGK
ncbi:MAG: hypothetical protein J6A96_00110 [Clostridia bacterium]|nr:hypothetical protein [Clostridia bacterium]